MKKLTVYPSSRALEILGASATTLNRALDCWANVVARASVELELDRAEWCYLADVLNGTLHEPAFDNPGELLAGSIEDGHSLDGLGDKWFDKDFQKRVDVLAAKLRELDYAHSWAVIIAVQFFWENCNEIDLQKDNWWTVAFRRQFGRADEPQIVKRKRGS